jgi:hypothetical protein
MARLDSEQLLTTFDDIVVKFLEGMGNKKKIVLPDTKESLTNDWKKIYRLAKNNKNELAALDEFKELLKSIDYGDFSKIPKKLPK